MTLLSEISPLRREVVLDGGCFRGQVLEDLDMRGFSLRDADLSEAQLLRCNLSGVDLTGARAEGLRLRGSSADADTCWPQEQYDHAKLGVTISSVSSSRVPPRRWTISCKRCNSKLIYVGRRVGSFEFWCEECAEKSLYTSRSKLLDGTLASHFSFWTTLRKWSLIGLLVPFLIAEATAVNGGQPPDDDWLWAILACTPVLWGVFRSAEMMYRRTARKAVEFRNNLLWVVFGIFIVVCLMLAQLHARPVVDVLMLGLLTLVVVRLGWWSWTGGTRERVRAWTAGAGSGDQIGLGLRSSDLAVDALAGSGLGSGRLLEGYQYLAR